MPFELSEHDDRTVTPSEMEDGQVGVIVRAKHGHHEGRVVQKFGDNRLVSLGLFSENAWSSPLPTCRVRLLEDGEQLTYRKPN